MNKRRRIILESESSSDEYNSSEEESIATSVDSELSQFTSENVTDVNSIDDLIKIGEEWNTYVNKNKFYQKRMSKRRKVQNIFKNNDDFVKLAKILDNLYELKNMVGMKELKESIVEQILFFVQNLQGDELMHTVLVGFPGTGKTSVGRILGNIYKELGILSRGTFTCVQRSDFIGKYLGHTADKTRKLLESCLGGVMFLDEAYSLGPKNGDSDSFSKEAIDTLNQFLSENNKDFICIIAGYENELENCFFKRNPGLERRFPWKFKINKYSPEELYDIFIFQMRQEEWKVGWMDEQQNDVRKKFDENKDIFNGNGGDCKILLDKCKVSHARRIFGKQNKNKFTITIEDFNNGLKTFKMLKNLKEKKLELPSGLYI